RQTEFHLSDFFFDNSNYPGCELPCWKGLRIGKSTSADVQHMFDTEFRFNGMLNFRTDTTVDPRNTPFDISTMNDTYPMGYHWPIRPQDDFYAVAMVNKSNDLLEGFIFSWSVNFNASI